jgi:integrase/recombinase XerD
MPDPRRRRQGKPPRKAPRNTQWVWREGDGWTLEGRVRIRGRLKRWSLRTSDVEIAVARVREEIEKLKAASFYGDARPKYRDVFARWVETFVQHEVAATTARRYGVSLKQLEPFLIDLYFDEIDGAKITEIVNARRDAKVTTATIRRDLGALASVIEFGIDENLRKEGDNPALLRLKKLRERRDPIVLPQHWLIDRVIAEASPSMAPLIKAALKTGARQNELVTAKRSAVDHARRQLTVNKGKGSKLRVIDLDFGGGYEAIRSAPSKLGCDWLFWHEKGGSRRRKKPLRGPVAATLAQPYTGVSGAFHVLVRRVIELVAKEAKAAGAPVPEMRPFRFHDLRHRHAVDWLKAGRSIYDLQQRLGHNSITTTEIYLKYLTPEEARVSKFGESQKESYHQRFGA